MKKKLAATSIIYLLLNTNIYGQSNFKCFTPIHIPEFKIYLRWLKNNDTIVKTEANKKFRLHFFSCQGDMYLQQLDSNGNILMEGPFCKSLDTLREYGIALNPYDPYEDGKMEVEKYFEPLKSGTWLYYNEKHEIYKTELWYQGIIKKKKNNSN